jgi:hypothetical protein
VVEAAGDKMGKAHDLFKERPNLLLYLSKVLSDPERLREIFFARDRYLSSQGTRLSLDFVLAKLKEVRSARDLRRLASKAIAKALHAIKEKRG